MYNYNKFKSHTATSIHPLTEYSVLIPIVKINGEDALLFQLRAKMLKRQPGEISFPGGKREGDESLETTAIRETTEELGLTRGDITLYGEMDYILRNNSKISVFVARLNIVSLDDLKLNKDEVDSVFTIPIQQFKAHPPIKHTIKQAPIFSDDFPFDKIQNGINYDWQLPSYDVYFYEINNQIIWGLTAKITHHFLNCI